MPEVRASNSSYYGHPTIVLDGEAFFPIYRKSSSGSSEGSSEDGDNEGDLGADYDEIQFVQGYVYFRDSASAINYMPVKRCDEWWPVGYFDVVVKRENGVVTDAYVERMDENAVTDLDSCSKDELKFFLGDFGKNGEIKEWGLRNSFFVNQGQDFKFNLKEAFLKVNSSSSSSDSGGGDGGGGDGGGGDVVALAEGGGDGGGDNNPSSITYDLSFEIRDKENSSSEAEDNKIYFSEGFFMGSNGSLTCPNPAEIDVITNISGAKLTVPISSGDGSGNLTGEFDYLPLKVCVETSEGPKVEIVEFLVRKKNGGGGDNGGGDNGGGDQPDP